MSKFLDDAIDIVEERDPLKQLKVKLRAQARNFQKLRALHKNTHEKVLRQRKQK